jgi:hypothetical protein
MTTQSCLSYAPLVQILTENNRGKENIIPDSRRNYNIQIKKGMKILQRTRKEFTGTISF